MHLRDGLQEDLRGFVLGHDPYGPKGHSLPLESRVIDASEDNDTYPRGGGEQLRYEVDGIRIPEREIEHDNVRLRLASGSQGLSARGGLTNDDDSRRAGEEQAQSLTDNSMVVDDEHSNG
jgi:hypothetical protein